MNRVNTPLALSTLWVFQPSQVTAQIPRRNDEDLIDRFVDCIERKAQPTCGVEQALHMPEILFKRYEAARTGSAQMLAPTFTPWHAIKPRFLDTQSGPF